jgi:hypothetical protein
MTARRPESRLDALQTGNPYQLTIEGVMEGGKHEEEWLHNMFSDIRIRGEWFEYTPMLRRFIFDRASKIEQYNERGILYRLFNIKRTIRVGDLDIPGLCYCTELTHQNS